ncbi:MAG: ABC transporter ATP-binding protein [Hydrogenothermaceae bacterium]
MDSSSPLLRVKNLTKKYPIKKSFFKKEFFYAVSDVSFDIYRGEVVGLVGESGSGKSTIGRLILGLIKPDSGEIIFENQDIPEKFPKNLRREISIIFQDPRTSLNPRFKIFDILAEPLIVNGYTKKDVIREKVLETLSLVELDKSFIDRYPHELSGGQRQRVAIGRAIVLNPKLIVADEPTSALDVSIQLQIVNLIKNLNKEKGITFIFISHDINVVSNLSNKIIVLYKGKVMEYGDTYSVINNPKHPYTKILLDSLPPENPKHRKIFPDIPEEDFDSFNFEGCEFYFRCPIKTDICKTKPQMKKTQSGEVYCHLV